MSAPDFAEAEFVDAVPAAQGVRVSVTAALPTGAEVTVSVAYPDPRSHGGNRIVAGLALGDVCRGMRAVLGPDGVL